jgi:hypothetical protein
MVFTALIAPNSTVIVVCPSPTAVTIPSVFTVTTAWLPDVHRDVDVRSYIVPSAYVTIAERRPVSPRALSVVMPLIVMAVTAGTAAGVVDAALGALGDVNEVFWAPHAASAMTMVRARGTDVGL